MNASLYTTTVMFNTNSTKTTLESWFIPLDILAIVCLTLVIMLASSFLLIIILDKTCHTIPMIFTTNICLTGLLCGCVHLAITVYQLYNDLKHIEYENSICFILGFLSYATCALHNYSYVSSAIYRYITIVYSTRLLWQSARVQVSLTGLGWILAFVFPLLFIFTNTIVYNVDNQMCQVPFRLSVIVFYAPSFIYIIPVHLVVFIYMKLVRFVRSMSERITPSNTLTRAQRDLKMVRRVVMLIHILFISGFPLSLFIFLSFANQVPKYHFRIGFMFVYASMLLVMIALFQVTDSLHASVRKILFGRSNLVRPTLVR